MLLQEEKAANMWENFTITSDGQKKNSWKG